MFKFGKNEFVEPPGRVNIFLQRLFSPGIFVVCFCLISCIGFISAVFTGVLVIPGRTTVHIITLSEHPLWFLLGLFFCGVVVLFSGGFIWFRVLGHQQAGLEPLSSTGTEQKRLSPVEVYEKTKKSWYQRLFWALVYATAFFPIVLFVLRIFVPFSWFGTGYGQAIMLTIYLLLTSVGYQVILQSERKGRW